MRSVSTISGAFRNIFSLAVTDQDTLLCTIEFTLTCSVFCFVF